MAQVRLGRPELLDPESPKKAITAFRKQPTTGPVRVHALGLEGDTQVNRRWHGGPDKAVYSYPLSGYAGWIADLPALAARFVPGGMGENLCIDGQDEAIICIGDVIRAGTATLQVAQIREPCHTLAQVVGTPKVARAMVRSGRSGWYCRVIEPGTITAGDAHDVIERPNPGWTMLRFSRFSGGGKLAADELAELSRLPGLTPDWQVRAAKLLAARA
ncbi:molybdenum cofactor sulfurase [Polymorphobacter multimanifer]|uniref:MOSC domain-containing protein YiiM n=1 Tax=Polymorphobacter multimanifer TaxID=1070431 RepID=A0A841KZ97_9SPHN|nr:MOSC domain-containing protein [Polymorphobacter multimanifer]MBB6225879.1 MOSC domain-containing protein YiiM [Polymorphobacter multimanifer]GGI74495.1 molybdenum cofactor sulfurase [Polymorphobacter multimanifer]